MTQKSRGLRAVLLVLATLIAYVPALRGGYVWDDDIHVTKNATLTSLAGLEKIWREPMALPQYYPLVHTAFWVERHLFGLKPLGFHLVNVLLHAINALLLGWVLARLSVPGGWLAAAIFALHPVQVESVAWITELKNVLSGFFYFAAALCFLRFYDDLDDAARRRRRGVALGAAAWYGAGFLLYLCALLSKTVTATLPLALLIVLWWKRDRLRFRHVVPLVPLLVVGAVLGIVTVWLEKHHVGAFGKPWGLSPLDRVLLAGRVLWFYASKLVWPSKLSFFYPRWSIDSSVWWQYLFPLSVMAVLLLLGALRHRIGKAPLAAVLFFSSTLLPALGFFDVYPMRFSWVADHFQYLASAGLIAFFSALAATWVARFGAGFAAAAATPLLLLLGALTWRQGLIYRDTETLWRDTIAKTPEAWMPHDNLGVILLRRGQTEEAMRQFSEAARLKPDAWEPHENLGDAHMQRGEREAAIQELGEAVRLEPVLPDVQLNLGNQLADAGRTDEAIRHYEQAMVYAPGNPAAPYNLGNALLETGRVGEAIARFQQALRIDPRHVNARINLGNALGRSGRTAEAIEQYRQALKLDPSVAEAHNNLGVALARVNHVAEAIEQYEQALSLKPDYGEAANNLGLALVATGRWSEAIDPFERALRSRPDLAEAHNNLGVALTRVNRVAEAIEHFEQALRIKPDFGEARANLHGAREALPKLHR